MHACVHVYLCIIICQYNSIGTHQALLELYNSDALIQFDEEKLLALAEKAKL